VEVAEPELRHTFDVLVRPAVLVVRRFAFAHVAADEIEARPLESPGRRDAAGGQIDACDAEAPVREVPRVASRAAAEVERRGAGARRQAIDERGDECRRFRFVAVRVEAVIVRGVEP
jgi:hypothetical protein